MRKVHELNINELIYDDVIANVNQLLVLEKEVFNKGDYILLKKLHENALTGDTQLIEINSIIEDEHIIDGYAIMKIKLV